MVLVWARSRTSTWVSASFSGSTEGHLRFDLGGNIVCVNCLTSLYAVAWRRPRFSPDAREVHSRQAVQNCGCVVQ